MSGDLENLILSTIERWWAGRYSERHGLVTSYDPTKHLAKVTFQPEGQESGWLPIETGHIGEGFGIAVGLTTGDGKKTGDQVIVRYQEGDFESGKIVQRVHSEGENPPAVQSGEIVVWTKFKNTGGIADGGIAGTGQKIYLKKDGTATVTDGNGATIILDGNGNIKITANLLQVDVTTFTAIATGNAGIKGSNVEVQATSNLGLDAGSEVIVQGGGSVSDGSVSPAKNQPPVPPFQVP